jgi:hypothetical protein
VRVGHRFAWAPAVRMRRMIELACS